MSATKPVVEIAPHPLDTNDPRKLVEYALQNLITGQCDAKRKQQERADKARSDAREIEDFMRRTHCPTGPVSVALHGAKYSANGKAHKAEQKVMDAESRLVRLRATLGSVSVNQY